MNQFKLIRPKSLSDSAYAEFEYLIRWIGRNGADYQYMFYDAEIENRVDTEVINQEDSDNIQSLINRVSRTITLTTNDLSLNDLKIIAQILENKRVTRIKLDGTYEYYAPDGNRFNYRLLNGRYELTFDLVMLDIKSWK